MRNTIVGLLLIVGFAAALIWATTQRTPDPNTTAGAGDSAVAEESKALMDGVDSAEILDANPALNNILNMTLTLETDLPTDETEGSVWLTTPPTLSEAEIKQFAENFGFMGNLYLESDRIVGTENDPFATTSNPYPVYIAFDGPNRLTFYTDNISFMNGRVTQNWKGPASTTELPFADAQKIATAFLEERGLLDFEYEIMQGWGTEIQFMRTGGQLVTDESVATIQLDADGTVAFADYRIESTLTQERVEPLISAETAWQQLSASPGSYQFNYRPSLSQMEATFNQFTPQHWQRTYPVGEEISVFVWIQAYESIAGGDIYLLGDQMILESAEVEELAKLTGRMTQLTGTIIDDNYPPTLQVTAWDSDAIPTDNYLNGVVTREGDQVTLMATDGRKVRLPDAPDGLENSAEVGVFGWSLNQTEGDEFVLDWTSIDQMNNAAAPPPEEQASPYNIDSATVHTIELIHRTYFSEDPFDSTFFPRFVPFWQFSASSPKDELIEFYVPAIDLNVLSNNQ